MDSQVNRSRLGEFAPYLLSEETENSVGMTEIVPSVFDVLPVEEPPPKEPNPTPGRSPVRVAAKKDSVQNTVATPYPDGRENR